MLSRYVEFLHEELRSGVGRTRLMPGIRELLAALAARDDMLLGLLTGNLADGARAKLGAAGIDPAMFRVGAYGSDHEARTELPGVAQRRAREELGIDIAGHDIVVIGDTPADIQCGRSIGARAIAVATGHYTADELRQHDPAGVFEDLSATEDVVRAIVDGGHTAASGAR
jgi:phosphoglycolate phosphatase-like HAD superfamily hydrolase